jgi:hypothetical protein
MFAKLLHSISTCDYHHKLYMNLIKFCKYFVVICYKKSIMILRQWKSIKWYYICAWYVQKLCTILKQPTTFNQECHILSKSTCSYNFQTFTLKARIFRLLLVSPFEFWYYIFQVVRRRFHSPCLRCTNLWVVTCLRHVLLSSLYILFFRLSVYTSIHPAYDAQIYGLLPVWDMYCCRVYIFYFSGCQYTLPFTLPTIHKSMGC